MVRVCGAALTLARSSLALTLALTLALALARLRTRTQLVCGVWHSFEQGGDALTVVGLK